MNFNPGSWLKNTDLYKYLAAIPIPAFIVLIAVLIPFDNRAVFEPPWLLPVLNTVFIFAIYFAVAYISAKSYLASGSLSIFLLGCGMLAFGFAALLGGWLIAAPGGINVNVTLVNIGALLGSIFHLMGAMLTSMRVNPELNSKRRKRNLTLVYPGVLILIILFAIASLQGITPPFFIQGTGPTLLRQVVLGTAAVLFAVSALLFIRLYSKLKEIYLYWYSLALMLVAVDLFAALLQHAVGSPIGWAGRLALYLGGIYFLNAIFIARRTAHTRGISIEEAVANFFREPEENFRVLVETANDAIVSFDDEGRVLLWNSAAEKIFGYNRSEAVGSILGDLIIPDSYTDAIKKEMENLTVTGKSTQIGKTTEIEAKRKDGKVFPVEFSVSARKTSDGWMYTSIIRDITERKRAEEALCKANDELELRVRERTAELAKSNESLQAEIAERKQAEEALRESEERLKLAQKAANAGTWDWNMLTGELKWSEEYYLVYGLTTDYEPSYENWLKTIHPDDRDMTNKAVALAIEQKIDIDIVFRTIHPDGNLCWLNAKGKTFYDEANRPIRMVGITLDISQRKQTEKKIQEQADLLDKAKDVILVQDLEHRITYYNQGAQHLYGYTQEEATGKNADELLYKEESSQLIAAKKSVIEKGEWMGELCQITRDGKEIIAESRWTLVHDDGKPKSILIINTDITEKKMFEAHLLRAQRMESIGILAGGIAHNLNNMLTPMMMSLHMLKQKLKDEQSQKLLTILEQNSQRSADLIKQVLSFSRGVEGERNPLQAKHIITEIEKIAKETFPRNIEIRTDIPKDLFTIPGDATQLHQVIMNLCVNASDVMLDGGILNITASNFFIDENYARMHTEAKVGSYVAISVSDTGIGIPPKILDRIFEPFFTTKEFGKGTGLGLSTALAIVKSHGGFINVYSEVGKGTTFRVYLPATLAEMQNVEEQKLELLTGHGELVLVAEDEDSVREVTVSTLENYGYSVLSANDGADAAALYTQNADKIKVVLMDMMMPVMDGHASIRAVRKINPEVKIIAVSGLAEKEKLKHIADNANAFLPKPYTAEILLKTVHEVLSVK